MYARINISLMCTCKQRMLTSVFTTSIQYFVLQKTDGWEFTYIECHIFDSTLIVITIKKTLEDNLRTSKAGYLFSVCYSATSFFTSTLYIIWLSEGYRFHSS